MIKIGGHILSWVFLILGFSCSMPVEKLEIKEYLSWINASENNISKHKIVNGLDINVKFLPPEFLTYREIEKDAAMLSAKDSLYEIYSNSMSFLMTLGPDERQEPGSNVMHKGVSDYSDYTKRVGAMNFDMDQYVKIIVDGVEYLPVLSAMENVYTLTPKRSILFVFVPKERDDPALLNAKKIDFVYSDELFDLGVNHFVFNKTDLENRPLLAAN